MSLIKYLFDETVRWLIFEFFKNAINILSKIISAIISDIALTWLNNNENSIYPTGIYLLKVNNRNTRTRCEIYSKLTIKIPEWLHRGRSGVFIVNFERILHLAVVFLFLTLNM